MGYKVRFEPFGIEIECGEEETLLEAALRHILGLDADTDRIRRMAGRP